MSGRAMQAAIRILFFISGVVACVAMVPYAMLRGVGLPYQSEWIIFVIVFPLAGVISLLAAVLPASWTARIWGVQDKSVVFSLPLKLFGAFVIVAYILTIALCLTPHEWSLDSYLWTFLLCPVYLVRADIDPQPGFLFGILAPIDAAVYGAVGSALGFVLPALFRRTPRG